MSNHCRRCRFDPRSATGDDACPFTTLFWAFLARHREGLAANPRIGPMWRNLDRIEPARLAAILDQAEARRATD